MLSNLRGLIATDIDGTLLGSHGILPEENIRAIHYAQENHVIVSIASGRFPENVYFLLTDHGLRCPIIGSNGAQIVDEELNVLASHTMSGKTGTAIRTLLEAEGANYFVFGPSFICTSQENQLHHSELSQGNRLAALGVQYYHGLAETAECCRQPVQKFFVCNNVPLKPLREKLRAIPGILLTQSSPTNIEIMPEGVDKGQGLRDLAALLGIPMTRTMALGDEGNDIAMLQAAAYGTAMGNASDAAKAAARFLTGSNTEGGWAKAVIRFVDEMNR